MQQRLSILFTLIGTLICTGFAHAKSAPSSTKTTEVLSDPHGYGVPTVYTVLRGKNSITFSHPFLGQFTRAEVKSREQNGFVITRFRLAPNRKKYLPVLRLDLPFEKFAKIGEKPYCEEDVLSTTAGSINEIKKTVDFEEQIKKIKSQLLASKIIDSSCTSKEIEPQDQAAIIEGVAQVFAQSNPPAAKGPRYLHCLESYGYAHESGLMQAMLKQSKEGSLAPKLKFACTADEDADPGKFDAATNTVTLGLAPKPERAWYSKIAFHEMGHSIGFRGHEELAVMEDCCSTGNNCDRLAHFAAIRKQNDRKIAAVERLEPLSSVESAKIATLVGPDAEAFRLDRQSAISTKSQFYSESKTSACLAEGSTCTDTIQQCQVTYKQLLTCVYSRKATADFYSPILGAIFPKAFAETRTCSGEGELSAGAIADTKDGSLVRFALEPALAESLAESVPVTSPIDWSAPKPLPNQEPIPMRGIASVSPLPSPRSDVHLGEESNRRDLSTGRATFIMDTAERAASKVAAVITPKTIAERTIDRDKVFSTKSARAAAGTLPTYMVASFQGERIKVADISDLDLGFKNPFENAKPVGRSNQELKIAGSLTDRKNQAASESPNQAAQTQARPQAKPQNEKSVGDAIERDLTTTAKGESKAGITAEAAGPQNTRSTSMPTANAPTTRNLTNQPTTHSRNPTHTPNTAVESTDLPAFASIAKKELYRFLSNEFSTVAGQWNNGEFRKALDRYDIRVVDNKGNPIGSAKPKTKFIYNPKLDRLVQTGVDR